VTPATTPTDLTFNLIGSSDTIHLSVRQLLIAGYTGADQDAVKQHIAELAAIGIPPPPRVPMFYEIPTTLATTASTITVDSPHTSGEVEPVVIHDGHTLYLTLGSDHTDREIEKHDVAQSKASAPKPLSSQAIPLDQATSVWDQIRLFCRVDDEDYQRGPARALLTPHTLLETLATSGHHLTGGSIMFCGTLPLIGGAFRFGAQYQLQLTLPGGASLTHTYDVTTPGS
jgi:4-hydroxyphenylacetate 3-monooxygenase